MNACPYAWRIFAVGAMAGVWSVAGVLSILGLYVAAAKKRASNPNP